MVTEELPASPSMEALGNRMKAARLMRGWTQTELAEVLGTTKKTVGIWERTGEIPPIKLSKVMRALELPAMEDMGVTTEGRRSWSMTISQQELDARRTPLGQLHQIRQQLSMLATHLDRVIDQLEAADQA